MKNENDYFQHKPLNELAGSKICEIMELFPVKQVKCHMTHAYLHQTNLEQHHLVQEQHTDINTSYKAGKRKVKCVFVRRLFKDTVHAKRITANQPCFAGTPCTRRRQRNRGQANG